MNRVQAGLLLLVIDGFACGPTTGPASTAPADTQVENHEGDNEPSDLHSEVVEVPSELFVVDLPAGARIVHTIGACTEIYDIRDAHGILVAVVADEGMVEAFTDTVGAIEEVEEAEGVRTVSWKRDGKFIHRERCFGPRPTPREQDMADSVVVEAGPDLIDRFPSRLRVMTMPSRAGHGPGKPGDGELPASLLALFESIRPAPALLAAWEGRR